MKAAHVAGTEQALSVWAKRRAGDFQTKSTPPQNITQVSARLDAQMRALYHMERLGLDIANARILDVGAASGDGIRFFWPMGFSTDQLHGIDVSEERVANGLKRLPGVDFQFGDAAKMPYGDGSFDLVCEQFCFCHIPDADIKPAIAREMVRVTKPGGFVMVHDWRMGSQSRMLYGVSLAAIKSLFGLPIVGRFPSKLWPQIGRTISRFFPSMYFATRHIPFATGAWITILRKH